MAIDRFFGEYRFLSNFYPAKVLYFGFIWPSVEHAYQVAKIGEDQFNALPNDQFNRLGLMTAGEVKRWGRTAPIVDNWDQIRVPIMEQLVRYKFSDANPQLAEKLKQTYPHELIEGNTWGDKFWGVCNGEGQNQLGRMLMWRRYELIFTE